MGKIYILRSWGKSMFIKLDLVLPRGLSSLYSIYIKEERPFGLCQTDLISLGERRNRKCRSIQLRVGLVRNSCVFFWEFVISTFIQHFTKPLFIKYLNLRQFLLSSLGDNCVILYKAISCDVGTTLNCWQMLFYVTNRHKNVSSNRALLMP